MLKNCARTQARRKQTAVDLHRNWQAKTDAFNSAIALLRQIRACANQSCKVLFQADVTQELDVVCRHCNRKQKLTPASAASAPTTTIGQQTPTNVAAAISDSAYKNSSRMVSTLAADNTDCPSQRNYSRLLFHMVAGAREEEGEGEPARTERTAR